MALFKRNKNKEHEEKKTREKDALKEELSKAYDEIMSGQDSGVESEPENNNAGEFGNELFKAKVKAFVENRTEQTIAEVMGMLPGRKFLIPSVSNMKEPFEKVGEEMRLKKGAVINPALLTSKDKKMFLPIFTDEASMTQKSPSGIVLKLNFEQCVSMVYNKKNPVWAIVVNPFTENMILGEDLLRMVFKEKEKEE